MSSDQIIIDSHEGDSNAIEPYSSCNAVYEKYGSAENIWCWESGEGDWRQIGTLVYFDFATNIGMYLLICGAIASSLSRMSGVSFRRRSALGSSSVVEPLWRSPAPRYMAGAASTYTVANTASIFVLALLFINTALFFAIKIYIAAHPKALDIDNTHQQFDAMSFAAFYNLREIMLLSILCANNVLFFNPYKWYNLRAGGTSAYIATWSWYLSWADMVITFALFVYYYPLLLIWLYLAVVYFLLLCPVSIVGFVCIIPVSMCCMVPCAQVCTGNLGCIRIDEDENQITCRCSNNCVRFLFGMLGAAVVIAFYYFIIGVGLGVSFLMINGTFGPPQSVFFVDITSEDDGPLFYMFASTVAFGSIGLIVGVVSLIIPTRNSSSNTTERSQLNDENENELLRDEDSLSDESRNSRHRQLI